MWIDCGNDGDAELVDRGGGGVLRAGSDNWESATDEQPEFLYSSIWVCLLVQVYDLSLDIFSSFFLTEQGRGKSKLGSVP